jgi:hypothetical protein
MIMQEGRHFDPAIVEAFCNSWDSFLNARALAVGRTPELVDTTVSDDARR